MILKNGTEHNLKFDGNHLILTDVFSNRTQQFLLQSQKGLF
jgi:hypothetical protein